MSNCAYPRWNRCSRASKLVLLDNIELHTENRTPDTNRNSSIRGQPLDRRGDRLDVRLLEVHERTFVDGLKCLEFRPALREGAELSFTGTCRLRIAETP